jgi:2-hydroxychromene-2-carboxylate isomerase
VPTAPSEQPVFYYDLGSPSCYLVAERIMAVLPVVPEWEPVLGISVGEGEREPDRAAIERLAAERELLPMRWPARWPPDTRLATLAATFAKRGGRAVAFSLAAFRQAFAAGRDLSEEDTVLIAAAACEMHPAAVLKGIGLRSVQAALDRANRRARAGGVATLPAVQVGDRLFVGQDGVERAAEALEAPPA